LIPRLEAAVWHVMAECGQPQRTGRVPDRFWGYERYRDIAPVAVLKVRSEIPYPACSFELDADIILTPLPMNQ
jgi:hypothetical protein